MKFNHFFAFFKRVQNINIEVNFQPICHRISAYDRLAERIVYVVNIIKPSFILLELIQCQIFGQRIIKSDCALNDHPLFMVKQIVSLYQAYYFI